MASMGFTDIHYTKEAGIARITIDRQGVYNAFTLDTLRELQRAFDDCRDDPSVGVVVLTGAGDHFSTGGDVNWERGFTPEVGRAVLNTCYQLSLTMRNLGKPIIARVRGYCIAGGNELNVLCDLTIAATDAKFGQAGPRVGSAPIWWATQLLPRTIGEKKAREMVYLCKPYTAEEAERMGLVNKVVPVEQLDEEVDRWCRDLLAKSPQALRLSKLSLNAGSDDLWSSLFHAGDILTLMYSTEEFHEGMRAFLEKRKPDFAPFRRSKAPEPLA